MEEHQNDDIFIISKWVQIKCKNVAKTSLKMFFYTLVVMLDIMLESLALMLIGAILLLLGFCVLITTPIWAMFLFFTWIPAIIMVLVIMYSKIGESVIRMFKRSCKWLLYDSTKPRRWIWARYYDFISWIYPEDSFYIMNSGYALLSEDGLMNKFNPLDHEKKEIYQYQLYYYVSNLYGKDVIAGKKIIDVCCGRGGGTYFMYSFFKPKKIIGVDISSYFIQTCRETFVEEEQKSLIKQRTRLRTKIAKKYSISHSELSEDQEIIRSRTQSMCNSMKAERIEQIFTEGSPTHYPANKSNNKSKFHDQGNAIESDEQILDQNKSEDEIIEVESAKSLLQKIDELCELEFYCREAETLSKSFAKNSFDCIISVESSNCIVNLEEFFKSCFVLLKNPSETMHKRSSFDISSNVIQPCSKKEIGIFLFADYFELKELENIKRLLQKYFTILKSENITANVYHAIKIDGARRRQTIISSVNCLLKRLLNRCSFDISNDLKSKKKVYYTFVLQKREDVDVDEIL